jgi:hypothetical protein
MTYQYFISYVQQGGLFGNCDISSTTRAEENISGFIKETTKALESKGFSNVVVLFYKRI